MTNEELIEKYRQTGEQRLRDRLVLENMGLVFHIYRSKFHWLELSRDEISSQGTVSLLKAIDKFDLFHGGSFGGYGGMVIARDFQDLSVKRLFTASIGSARTQKNVLIYVPRRMQEYEDNGMASVDALTKACADYKISIERAAEIFAAANAPAPSVIGETTASNDEECADTEASLTVIEQCIRAALSEREQDIVRRRFILEEEFMSIAESYNLSVERIRQLLRGSIPKLAAEMDRRGLSFSDFSLN